MEPLVISAVAEGGGKCQLVVWRWGYGVLKRSFPLGKNVGEDPGRATQQLAPLHCPKAFLHPSAALFLGKAVEWRHLAEVDSEHVAVLGRDRLLAEPKISKIPAPSSSSAPAESASDEAPQGVCWSKVPNSCCPGILLYSSPGGVMQQE